MDPRSVLEVDLDAIAHNVGVLRAAASDSLFCAVVKADGYGHGAVEVAHAALGAGADWLAVSQVAEARPIRRAGLDVPVLLLSEPIDQEIDQVIDLDLRALVYRRETVDRLDERVRETGAPSLKVHLKVDTGMQRVGCRPDEAADLASLICDARCLELEGFATHLAVADEPNDPTTAAQLEIFADLESEVAARGIEVSLVHVANSAGTIAHPGSRRDLVRCGIAMYGVLPGSGLGAELGLRPALSFRSQVTLVKSVRSGTRVSYGLRHTFARDTVVATVPVGYADGVPRSLGQAGAEVLIGERRCPMVGVVTMDQFVVDCGPGSLVSSGDEVVLLGPQGDDGVRAEEWAAHAGTIGYEIVCNVGRRAERRWIGGEGR